MSHLLAVAPGMAVIAAVALASLCPDCIAERARMWLERVMSELREINAARERRSRPAIGPIDAHCQKCEARKPTYRLI